MAEILKAIAALLWPIFAFSVLIYFRKEIKNLFGRLKRGKLFGQEIELEDLQVRLQESAKVVVQEVVDIPEPRKQLEAAPLSIVGAPSPEEKVLEESGRSPKAALMLLASELDREVRDVVANLGLFQGRKFITMTQGLETLRQREALPSNLADSLRLFSQVRNRLVHGYDASEDEIFRAIDSGATLLKAVQAIPHEVNVVYHPGVDLYSDPGLTQKIEGARGVILETENPQKTGDALRIFPSTREHFRKGMRVSWEWSRANQWDEAWYKHPDTGEVKKAWDGALEFVGRDLDTLPEPPDADSRR